MGGAQGLEGELPRDAIDRGGDGGEEAAEEGVVTQRQRAELRFDVRVLQEREQRRRERPRRRRVEQRAEQVAQRVERVKSRFGKLRGPVRARGEQRERLELPLPHPRRLAACVRRRRLLSLHVRWSFGLDGESAVEGRLAGACLLYTSPSPRDS